MLLASPIMLTVLTYLWESGSLKYLQTVKPCFKIPIECISRLENICKTYFRTLKYVKILRIVFLYNSVNLKWSGQLFLNDRFRTYDFQVRTRASYGE